MKPRSGFWVALTLLAACHKPQAEQQVAAEPKPCEAAPDQLPAPKRLGRVEGKYDLRMAATTGKSKGTTVDGKLRLAANDTAHLFRGGLGGGGATDTTTRYPYYGSAEIDLVAVDAVRPGELASFDPDLPGVLAIESPSAVMLRLGTESNRPGVVRFDGGYTVLRVRRLHPDGFDGDWSSGASMPVASGYFCAVRAADSTS
ncbi:MAG TPA: hypothetical protein VH763_15395 [Gemmatimonadales bacterium]|jgi:hypothetical protein